MNPRWLLSILLVHGAAVRSAPAVDTGGELSLQSIPTARFAFSGPVGERVQANLEQWLLRAPRANPGIIEMFRLRDRQPTPQIVPWAGEFVGKYLLSGVCALPMTEDPRLRKELEEVVQAWLETQAEDGYLGPFPRSERLLKHWDLWGHYHAIEALLAWHEQTGDEVALAAARRAADLVCTTYLDAGRRVFEAGDPEMNMSILTALAHLYRITGEPRYLRMAREVEKDWERAGDYLQAGLDGREFFQSPRPRWESLHDLQGLLELWRITGEARYHEVFEHHWRSIRRWDLRNTGGFSSGEQATGNPYAETPIETCCTVAWMALTVDHLRLTGDARSADALELATLNAGLGAQHPSGRWWTYNTPMNGVREASAHTIVFQARAGTPELNCCSVNGPRVLGLLSDWALMTTADALVLNWLGAARYTCQLPGGERVTITSSRDAWLEGTTEVRVDANPREMVELRVRVPRWASSVRAALNGVALEATPGGQYLVVRRRWAPADRLVLEFDMPVAYVAGANEMAGRVSLYRGPLLLAYDQAVNSFDEGAIPSVDLARLTSAQPLPAASSTAEHGRVSPPWLAIDVPTVDRRSLRLVDFASAGVRGTRYRSWLPAQPAPPAPAFTRTPPDGARFAPGEVQFRWRGARGASETSYRVEFGTNQDLTPVLWSTNASGQRCIVDTARLTAEGSASPRWYYWRVVTAAGAGETTASVPAARFRIDAAAPPQALPPEPVLGPDGELVVHSLRTEAAPQFGEVASSSFTTRDADGTETNGRDQMLRYAIPGWPDEDYSVAVSVRLGELPQGRLGQVFSAWCTAMDDPLRLVIDGGRLHARIEAGAVFSTSGTEVVADRWYALAAVKRAGTLTLFVNGRKAGACDAPEFLSTQTHECALGGNPRYPGNEFLAARFADFRLYGRALGDDEVQRLARPLGERAADQRR